MTKLVKGKQIKAIKTFLYCFFFSFLKLPLYMNIFFVAREETYLLDQSI